MMPPLTVDLSALEDEHLPLHQTKSNDLRDTLLTVDTEVEESREEDYIASSRKSSQNPKHRKKSVSFSTISLQYYPIILGDNPACSQGPPITIDWDHFAKQTFDVDYYESEKECSRDTSQMRIPGTFRARLLKITNGTTNKEIQPVLNEVRRIQLRRLSNSRTGVIEGLKKKAGKLLGVGDTC